MRDLSEDYSLLAIQGPKAVEAMQSLSSHDLSAISFYNFIVGDFAGIEHVIISATGYTGSGGFEIYCKNSENQSYESKLSKSLTILYPPSRYVQGYTLCIPIITPPPAFRLFFFPCVHRYEGLCCTGNLD